MINVGGLSPWRQQGRHQASPWSRWGSVGFGVVRSSGIGPRLWGRAWGRNLSLFDLNSSAWSAVVAYMRGAVSNPRVRAPRGWGGYSS